jgi:hypothetical protein
MDSEAKSKVLALAAKVASGWTVAGASRALEIPATTGRRWSRKPAFKRKVQELQAGIEARVVARFGHARFKVFRTLVNLLDDPDPEIRLKAATRVNADYLDMKSHAIEFRALAQLEGNLAEPTEDNP